MFAHGSAGDRHPALILEDDSLAITRLLVVWVFILLCATPSWAQFETGSITGTVTDNSGGALPGATVTLRNLDTNVTQITVTNDSGAYEFFTLRVGRYEVKTELDGLHDDDRARGAAGDRQPPARRRHDERRQPQPSRSRCRPRACDSSAIRASAARS